MHDLPVVWEGECVVAADGLPAHGPGGNRGVAPVDPAGDHEGDAAVVEHLNFC